MDALYYQHRPGSLAFFAVGGGERQATSAVLVGFILVYAFDLQFGVWRLVPEWWIKLRSLLTLVVCGCLLIGLFA